MQIVSRADEFSSPTNAGDHIPGPRIGAAQAGWHPPQQQNRPHGHGAKAVIDLLK